MQSPHTPLPPGNPPELHSKSIYDIEDEMNELIGFMNDVVMALSCIDENSLVFSVPYRLLMECERKMEKLDDICQVMVEWLIKNEKQEKTNNG